MFVRYAIVLVNGFCGYVENGKSLKALEREAASFFINGLVAFIQGKDQFSAFLEVSEGFMLPFGVAAGVSVVVVFDRVTYNSNGVLGNRGIENSDHESRDSSVVCSVLANPDK